MFWHVVIVWPHIIGSDIEISFRLLTVFQKKFAGVCELFVFLILIIDMMRA